MRRGRLIRPLLIVFGLSAAAEAHAAPAGQQMFLDNCSACHQPTGKGIPGAFPALVGDSVVAGDPAAMAHTVLFGRGGMPAFRNDLTDAQLAAILTYVRSAWGNKAGPVDEKTVSAARAGSVVAVHGLQAH